MKKKLNTEAIANELSGGSAFFQQAREQAAPAPAPAPDTTPPPPAELHAPLPEQPATSGVPPSPRSPVPPAGTYGADVGDQRTGPTGVPPGRRKINRHPFDVYTDQVARLKWLSLQEQLAGGQGSMSRMVREAIDAYLALHEPASEGEQGGGGTGVGDQRTPPVVDKQ